MQGNGLDPSAEDVRHFIRLVTLCQSDHPADRRWLEDTHALAGALALTGASAGGIGGVSAAADRPHANLYGKAL